MLRQLGLVLSVGLADSLNPSTVGPALYISTGRRAAWRVAQFTVGVFAVTFAGGLVLAIGPGRLLLGLVPHPQGTVRHIIEVVAGAVLLAAALGLWTGRHRLARRKLPMSGGASSSSALIAGASIAAVELLTAAPYFAVIAGVDASNAGLPQEVGLLAIYNLAFVAPLLAIIAVLLIAGDQAEPLLRKGGAWLQRRWPIVLAGLLMFVGSALLVLGGFGLLKR